MAALARILRRMADRLDPPKKFTYTINFGEAKAMHTALLELRRHRGQGLGLG